MFRSATDISGSAIFYELQKRGDKGQDISAKRKFNWRIALSSASLLLGFATFFYVSGVEMVYACVPLLGQARGKRA